ncbi:sigma-70 family RNA polymerase sigma factor [Ruegeria atlantica]|uniref:sigma-70 family RNA polymerase sigma factor n=1 Tax=Ruegeria atlantica TaxID=81569 RepID=UPI00147B7795|nr:sigma-70 family RNA polymerase sigma factor [Ruegeria atlantica]
MSIELKTEEFEKARPQLMGIAYRLLGVVAEAEDAVQDTAYKWFSATGPLPDKPVAWLTTVCTNRCLDILKSARRRRTDYVGPWLPEQFESESTLDVESQLEIASSLSTAFLLLLERLTPRERAAYLLHDIFGMAHQDIGQTLGLSTENSRKLASRARRMVSQENVRFVPSAERQKELLEKFRVAIQTGDTHELVKSLSQDVDLRADSGGKVTAITHILEGVEAVLNFFSEVLSPAWNSLQFEMRTVNGCPGLLIWEDDVLHALVSFSVDADQTIRSIFIQRHPEKLELLLEKKGRPQVDGSLFLQ